MRGDSACHAVIAASGVAAASVCCVWNGVCIECAGKGHAGGQRLWWAQRLQITHENTYTRNTNSHTCEAHAFWYFCQRALWGCHQLSVCAVPALIGVLLFVVFLFVVLLFVLFSTKCNTTRA